MLHAMRALLLVSVLAVGGCADACGPTPTAELVGGFWHVSLNGDGVTSCIGLPYYVPQRDTPEEAIRDCRAAR